MNKSIALLKNYPQLKIAAQEHLARWYSSFGFVVKSEVYWDVGIPHVDMVREQ